MPQENTNGGGAKRLPMDLFGTIPAASQVTEQIPSDTNNLTNTQETTGSFVQYNRSTTGIDWMDSIVSQPIQGLSNEAIPSNVKNYSDQQLDAFGLFFMDPTVSPELMHKYGQSDPSIFTADRERIMSEWYARNAEDVKSKYGIDNAKEYWAWMNNQFAVDPNDPNKELPEYDFETEKKKVLGLGEYYKRKREAADDGVITTFVKSAWNPIAGMPSAFTGLGARIVDSLDGYGESELATKLYESSIEQMFRSRQEITKRAMSEHAGEVFDWDNPYWWAAGAGSGFGSVGAVILAGAATGGLGLGAATGGIATGYLMSMNEVMQGVYEKTGDKKLAIDIGAAAAVPMSILEYWGANQLVSQPIMAGLEKKTADLILDEAISAAKNVGMKGFTKAAFSKEMTSVGTALWKEGYGSLSGLYTRRIADGMATEGLTEMLQSGVADLTEFTWAKATDDERIGKMWDTGNLSHTLKEYLMDGFFGAFVGGVTKGVSTPFHTPAGQSLGYVMIDEAKNGKRETYQKALDRIAQLEQRGEVSKEHAIRIKDQFAKIEEIAQKHIGTEITNRGAQQQIIGLENLRQELTDKKTSNLNGKIEGSTQTKLQARYDRAIQLIDQQLEQIKSSNTSVTMNWKTNPLVKEIAAMNHEFKLGVDMQQWSNLNNAFQAGLTKYNNLLQKINGTLRTKDLSAEQNSLIDEVEASTGLKFSRTMAQRDEARIHGGLRNNGITIDEAEAIYGDLSNVHEAWKAKKKENSKDGIEIQIEQESGEPRNKNVPMGVLNALFNGTENEKLTDLPVLKSYIEQQKEAYQEAMNERKAAFAENLGEQPETRPLTMVEIEDLESKFPVVITKNDNGGYTVVPKNDNAVGLSAKGIVERKIQELIKQEAVTPEEASQPIVEEKVAESEENKAPEPSKPEVVPSVEVASTPTTETSAPVAESETASVEEAKSIDKTEQPEPKKKAVAKEAPKVKEKKTTKPKKVKKVALKPKKVAEMTVAQLREQAKAKQIKGYSKMSKQQLTDALDPSTVVEVQTKESPVESRDVEAGAEILGQIDPAPIIDTSAIQLDEETRKYGSDPRIAAELFTFETMLRAEVESGMSEMSDEQIDSEIAEYRKRLEGSKAKNKYNRNIVAGLSTDPIDMRYREEMAEHYSRLFGIDAHMSEQLFDEFGTEVAAMATEAGVRYAKNATDGNIPHEYAHYYLRSIQLKYPRIWNAMKRLMANSPMLKQVEKGYLRDNLTEDEHYEEAIAQIIGNRNVEVIRPWFERNGFWERVSHLIGMFKNTLANLYNGATDEALADMVSMAMTFRASKINIPSQVIQGFTKAAYNRNGPKGKNKVNLIKAAVDAIVLSEGGIIRTKRHSNIPSLRPGTSAYRQLTQYFYESPLTYILPELVGQALNNPTELGEFLDLVGGEQAAKEFFTQYQLLAAKDAVRDKSIGILSRHQRISALVEKYGLLDAFNEKSEDEMPSKLLINRLTENTKGIPNTSLTLTEVEVNEMNVTPTFRQILIGLSDEQGHAYEVQDVFKVIHGNAVKHGQTTASFIKALKKTTQSGGIDGSIAEAFLNRIAAIKGHEIWSDSSENVLIPLIGEFRSMTINPHVIYDFMDGKINEPYIVNQGENPEQATERQMNQMANYFMEGNEIGEFRMAMQEGKDRYMHLRNEADKMEASIQFLRFMTDRLGLGFYVNDAAIQNALQERFPGLTDEQLLNRLYAFLVPSLSIREEALNDYFTTVGSLLNVLNKFTSVSFNVDSSYIDPDGKTQQAISFSTHLDRMEAGLFVVDESGKRAIDRMIEDGNYMYQDNDIALKWAEDGNTGKALLRQINHAKFSKAVRYDRIDKVAHYALMLYNFVNSDMVEYRETFELNGTRKYKYQFDVPVYETMDKAVEKYNLLGLKLAERMNRLYAEGVLTRPGKSQQEVLNEINSLYPFKLTLVDGKFDYEPITNVNGDLQTGNEEVTNWLGDQLYDVFEVFESLPESFKQDLLSKIGDDRTEAQRATDEFMDWRPMIRFDGMNLNDVVQLHMLNHMINQMELTDIMMGELVRLEDIAKVIKRSMGNGSKGYHHGELDSPLHVLVIPDYEAVPGGTQKGSDSFAVYNERFNFWLRMNGGTLQDFGDNHKLHIYDVKHEGPSAGRMDYIKHAAIGENDSNIRDLGGGYVQIADMLDEARKVLGENANVIIAYKSAIKSLSVDYTVHEMGKPLTAASFAQIKPRTIVSNFNINNDYNVKSDRKKLTTQLPRIISENAFTDPVQAEQFQNRLEAAIINVLKKQYELASQDFTDPQIIAKDLIQRVFSNDLFIASQSKLQYLQQLINDPASIVGNDFRHIEDVNVFTTALGHLTEHFNNSHFLPQMRGSVVQTVPDIGGQLKYHDGVVDIIVPEEIGKPGELLIMARVPTGSASNTFVGKVLKNSAKGINIMVVPNAFIEYSNSDHDGDQLHIFRKPELLESDQIEQLRRDLDSTLNMIELSDKPEEVKIKLRKQAHKKLNDAELNIEVADLWETMKDGMLTKDYITERNKVLGVDAIRTTEVNGRRMQDRIQRGQIGTVMGSLKNAEQLALGQTTIGHFANARKTISLLAQKKVTLAKPIPVFISGRTVNLARFTNDNRQLMAEFLQAALDQVGEMLLLPMGAQEEVIGEFIALAGLSALDGTHLSRSEIFEFFDAENDPVINHYVSEIKRRTGLFGTDEMLWEKDRIRILYEMLELDKFKQGETIAPQYERKIKELLSLAKEAQKIRDMMHILNLDDGIPFGVEEASFIRDTFERLETGEDVNEYEDVFGMPLFQHYRQGVKNFLNIINHLTLGHNEKFIHMMRSHLALINRNRLYKNDRKLMSEVTQMMLDRTALARKYVEMRDGKVVNMTERSMRAVIGQALSDIVHGKGLFGKTPATAEMLSVTPRDYEKAQVVLNNRNEYSADEIQDAVDKVSWYESRTAQKRDFAKNPFIKNLIVKLSKDGDYYVTMHKSVDRANETEWQKLKEGYDTLPQSFKNLLIDFTVVISGTRIRNTSLWGFLGSDIQKNRYRVAGDLIRGGESLFNSRNFTDTENKITESLMLNMADRIPTFREVKNRRTINRSSINVDETSYRGYVSNMFRVSADYLNANFTPTEMYSITVPSWDGMLGDRVEGREKLLPNLLRITENGEEKILLMADRDNRESKTRQFYYANITPIFTMIGGTAHSFTDPTEVVTWDSLSKKMFQDMNEYYEDLQAGLSATLGNQVKVEGAAKISEEQELYDKMVGHLQDTFGSDIKVMGWEEYQKQYGEQESDVIGQARTVKDAISRVVSWSLTDGMLDTAPHEYAHHYIDMFRNHPLIQEGLKKFGSEEALVDAVGKSYVSYAKRFWGFIKGVFGNNQVEYIIAQHMFHGTKLGQQVKIAEDYVWNMRNGSMATNRVFDGDNAVLDSENLIGTSTPIDQVNRTEAQALLSDRLETHWATYPTGNVDFVREASLHFTGTPDYTAPRVIRDEIVFTMNKVVESLHKQADAVLKNHVFSASYSEKNADLDPMYVSQQLFNEIETLLNAVRSGSDHETTVFGLGLAAKIANPALPLSHTRLRSFMPNADQEAQINYYYEQLMDLSAKLLHMSNGGVTSLVDGQHNAYDVKQQVDDSNQTIEMNKDIIKSLLGEKGLAATIRGYMKKLYSDTFEGLSSKMYLLTGGDQNPIYEMHVGQFETAEPKFARVFYGTAEEPGANQFLNDALSAVDGIVNYRFSNDKRFIGDVESFTFNDRNGEPVRLSLGEMITTYMYANHTDVSSGIVLRDLLKSKGLLLQRKREQGADPTRVVVFSEDELQRLEDVVRNFQGGVIIDRVIPSFDRLMDYTDSFINDTYTQLTGTEFLGSKMPYFFGIPGDTQGMGVSDSFSNEMPSLGEFRHVMQHNNLRSGHMILQVRDAFNMFNSHAYGAANYAAYAIPVRNLNRFINQKDSNGKTFVAKMDEVGLGEWYRNDVLRHLEMLINPTQRDGGRTTMDDTGIRKQAKSLMRHFYRTMSVAALGYNVAVAVTQLNSAMFADDLIQKRYLIPQFFNALKTFGIIMRTISKENLFKSGSVFDPVLSSHPTVREMYAKNPYIFERFYSGIIDPTQLASLGIDSSGNIGEEKKIFGVLRPSTAMGMIRMFDMLAIAQIHDAVKEHTAENHPQLAYDSPEYWNHVNHYVNKIIQRTQPTVGSIGRNKAQMDPGSLTSWLYMFGSQRVKMQDSLFKSYYQARHSGSADDWKRLMGNIFSKLLFGSFLYAAFKNIWNYVLNLATGKKEKRHSDVGMSDNEYLFFDTLFDTFGAFTSQFAVIGSLGQLAVEKQRSQFMHASDVDFVHAMFQHSILETSPERILKEASGVSLEKPLLDNFIKVYRAQSYVTGTPVILGTILNKFVAEEEPLILDFDEYKLENLKPETLK